MTNEAMVKTYEFHSFINNEEVKADAFREIRNPGRLSDIVGSVGLGTAEHVDLAVRSAHRAFQLWKNTSVAERCHLLLKAADVLEGMKEELAPLLSREAGILFPAARMEVTSAANQFRMYVSFADEFYKEDVIEDENGAVRVEKAPMGVVAAITPWNVPLMLCMGKVAPVLLTGNTVVVKPSPYAPMAVSLALQTIAGLFPPGVINVVHGDAEAGTALTTHPLVRKITFTGGGRTARHVMRAAAESLKSVHFELGGNDPAIVLDDANLDEVMPKIVDGAFRRAGQLCIAIKRVYIPEHMYADACELAREAASKFRIGYQMNENANLGPVNNQMQYDFVRQLVESTKQSKAEVWELGEKLEPEAWDQGYYLQPALVVHPDHDQEVVTCEQFGPVLPLLSYRTLEEAVSCANSTELGLGSSVWSSDEERALQVARQIESGMTFINGAGNTPLGIRHVPFGGVKQSGIGRERGTIGLAEFIEYHAFDIHKRKAQ